MGDAWIKTLKLKYMKWIKRILGIIELIKKQEETNRLLDVIADNTRIIAELRAKYNNHYHIR